MPLDRAILQVTLSVLPHLYSAVVVVKILYSWPVISVIVDEEKSLSLSSGHWIILHKKECWPSLGHQAALSREQN